MSSKAAPGARPTAAAAIPLRPAIAGSQLGHNSRMARRTCCAPSGRARGRRHVRKPTFRRCSP